MHVVPLWNTTVFVRIPKSPLKGPYSVFFSSPLANSTRRAISPSPPPINGYHFPIHEIIELSALTRSITRMNAITVHSTCTSKYSL